MNNVVVLILFAIGSYLFGNVNWAIIISKTKKTDIRSMGSGNPGTLNMSRNLGLKFGLWVEPERASSGSNNFNKNPEHYISEDHLSDYANPQVVEKLFSIICVVL